MFVDPLVDAGGSFPVDVGGFLVDVGGFPVDVDNQLDILRRSGN